MQSILFRNRIDAANKLAEKILLPLKKEHISSSRGGVVIGDVVAAKLNTKLDILVSRKIGAPDDPEFVIGAVMPDGTYFLNENDMVTFKVLQSYIEAEVNVQSKERAQINEL